MYLPIAATMQPQINAAVADVVRELFPDVQRINYEIAQDWSGQWAIFFKVLLSDEAAGQHHLRDVATKVVWREVAVVLRSQDTLHPGVFLAPPTPRKLDGLAGS